MLTVLIVLLATALVALAGEAVRAQCYRMLRTTDLTPLPTPGVATAPAGVPVAQVRATGTSVAGA